MHDIGSQQTIIWILTSEYLPASKSFLYEICIKYTDRQLK